MDFERTAARMDELLSELSGDARRTGRGAWSLTLQNGAPVRARASLRGGWLLLEVPTRKRADHGPSSFLRAHALLSGAARAVLPRGERNVMLRAEVPMETGVDPRAWLVDAGLGFTGFSAALESARKGEPEIAPIPAASAGPDDGADVPDLEESIEEAGWAFERRPDGSLSVDLEVPHGPFRAVVRRDGRGGVRAGARIARFAVIDDETGDALALYLLRAFAEIRLARPALRYGAEGGAAVSFEARVHGSPSSREMDHAVRALSVAARTCGKEVSLFQTKRFVTTYLQAFGRAREAAHGAPDHRGI